MKWICLPLMLLVCSAAVVADAARRHRDFAELSVMPVSDDMVVEEAPLPMGEPVMMDGYGAPAPSWYGGCCERQPSCGDHLWDNYCYEKDCGGCGFFKRHCCCGRIFGCGPFSRGCCKCAKGGCCQKDFCGPKCAPICCTPKCYGEPCPPKCCRKLCLPRLHLYDKCCTPKCYGEPCPPKCCRKLCLPRLFHRCHKSKCDKCCDGPVIMNGEVEMPVMDGGVMEVPPPAEGEIPAPPMIDQAA